MGLHYTLIDHTEKEFIDLGKSFSQTKKFQWLSDDAIIKFLFSRRGNNIQFISEKLEPDNLYEDYKEINI